MPTPKSAVIREAIGVQDDRPVVIPLLYQDNATGQSHARFLWVDRPTVKKKNNTRLKVKLTLSVIERNLV